MTDANALTDDARECLMDVVSHYRGLSTGLAYMLNQACVDKKPDDEAYWTHEIKALDRMLAQAERALAAPLEGTGTPLPVLTDVQWEELRRIARTYNEQGFPKHAREFFARAPRTEVKK